MAEIASLDIVIRAAAESVEAELAKVTSGVKDMAKEAEAARPKLDTSWITKAQTQVDQLRNRVAMLTDTFNDFGLKGAEGLGGFKDTLSAIELNLKSVEDAIAKGDKGLAGTSLAVAATQIEKVTEAEMTALGALEATEGAVASAAEGYTGLGDAAVAAGAKATGALEETGAAGMEAGTQTAAGAAVATVATVVWTNAVRMLKRALTSLGASLLIYPVINGIKDWIISLIKAREEAEKLRKEQMKANEEAIQGSLKTAEGHQKSAANIRTLAAEYATLARKKRTTSEDKRFLELENELAVAMGTTNGAIRAQVMGIDSWTEAINKAAGSETQKALEAMREANKLQAEQVRITNEGVAAAKKNAEQPRLGFGPGAGGLYSQLLYGSQAESDQDLKQSLESAQARYRELASGVFETTLAEMRQGGEKFSEGLAHVLKQSLVDSIALAEDYAGTEEQTAWMENFINTQLIGLKGILENADIGAGMEGFTGLVNKVFWGETSAEEAAPLIAEQLNNIQQAAYEAFVKVYDDCDKATEAAIALRASLTGGEDTLEFTRGVEEAGKAAIDAASGFKTFSETVEKTEAKIKGAKGMSNLLKDWKEAKTALANAKKGTEEWNRAAANADTVAGKLGQKIDVVTGSTKNADKAFEDYANNLKAQEADIVARIAELEESMVSAAAESQIEGNAQFDASQAQQMIDGLKAQLADLRVEMAAVGIAPGAGGGKGGGGGGGKKDDAAAEAERARKEAIQKDYDYIAHKRHMNEITLEEELAMLEKIREKHRLNAEEIMAWEEKVYDLKKEIRQRDSGSIDKMADGVITALQNRYQAMLDAEVERLDASREAWKTWRDDSVKAINDQITALDELSKTEDREKTDQEELRKIAKLKQDIEFEQDDYNRMKLQQQLDQAISSREDRLRKQERDDLKDALREQIKDIEERADAEITALDKEQQEIEKAYAERMKSTALRAEAEKMIMSSSQDEIIKLIGEYAPDYDALGKTLGEKLLDGFKNKVGNVVDWFKQLNDSLYAIQETAASQAVSAANAFYSGQSARQSAGATVPGTTLVNQTNNFNVPVESASQTARRIAQANEDLGALIYGG